MASSNAANPASVLHSAARAASFNVLLQVGFRTLTFALNALLVRLVAPEVLGVANVRLALLYTTTVFFAREAFRRACLNRAGASTVQVVNLVWCSVPVGMCIAAGMAWIWLRWLPRPDVAHYDASVWLFAFSCVVELLAEPLWVLAQANLFVGLKVAAEGAALFLRCTSTVALLLWLPHLGILAFALAQLLYAATFSAAYYLYFSRAAGHTLPIASLSELLPHKPAGEEPWLHSGMRRLVISFALQSWVKQLLTEGERMLMTSMAIVSFAEQGVYDIVSNLGSLVARFLFHPLEESFYTFFAMVLDRQEHLKRGSLAVQQQATQQAAQQAAQQTVRQTAQPHMEQQRVLQHSQSIGPHRGADVQLAAHVLACLLKFVLLAGLTIAAFGQGYAHLALHLYGGTALSASVGPPLLRAFSVYVLCMAANGITECFVFAAASEAYLRKYNGVMVGFTVVFLAAALLLSRAFGSVGFIAANCLNMCMRVAHHVWFISKYFRGTGLSPLAAAAPRPAAVVLLLCASWATSASGAHLQARHPHMAGAASWMLAALHVAHGALWLAAFAALEYVTDRTFLATLWQLLRRRGVQDAGKKLE